MKIQKVAIATCYYENNYGSKLQAYATQAVLDDLKIDNEFLHCTNPMDYMSQSKFLYYLKKIQDRDFEMKLGAIKKKRIRKKNPLLDVNLKIREQKFHEFVYGYFRISRKCIGIEGLKNTAKDYDAILVGSDQLWAPSAIEHGFFTLENINGPKKIAYSTSFGVNDLNKSQIHRVQKYLSEFDNIAVREDAGRNILKKYLNINVPVVLDPTLLLTASEWTSRLIDKERIESDQYIFFYFLGNNPEQHKIVQKLKEATGLKICGLLHLDNYIPEDEEIVDEILYDVGPKEFLNLIKNAEYVCTDSFHGSVFSILFHKQFITFQRNVGSGRSVNSRVFNLLRKLELNARMYDENKQLNEQLTEPIDYERVDFVLENLRHESLAYLKKALKIEEW